MIKKKKCYKRKIKKRKKKTKYLGIKIYKICVIFILIVFYMIMHNKKEKKQIIIYNNKINNNTSNNGRIFLCTSYNNEAEIVYIHLWRLYDYVDKFIIIVSNMTYQGSHKNITFEPFEKNIQPYMNKVDIAHFNNICNRKVYRTSHQFRCMEQSQRDYAKTYIEEKYNPTEKDILIVVDIDEILTREGIEYIKKNPPNNFYFIKGGVYFPYYYHRMGDWDTSFAIRYNKNKRTLTQIRGMKKNKNNVLKFELNQTKVLLTHCSYCFKTIEQYRNKLKSFAHHEYNKLPFLNNDWIFKSHYCRQKIGNSGEGYDEPYEGWKHLIPDDERLKYLIDRSFKYPLSQTTYNEKDLEKMCNTTHNRTPFELSAKYKLFSSFIKYNLSLSYFFCFILLF